MNALKKYWEWQKKPFPMALTSFVGGMAVGHYKLLSALLSII